MMTSQDFNILLAHHLMKKPAIEVLNLCNRFNPAVLKEDTFPCFGSMEKCDCVINFTCNIKINRYDALCAVSYVLINDTTVECIINLGRPVKPDLFNLEKTVINEIFNEFDGLFHNGHVQNDSEGEQVFTWRTNDSILISLISYLHNTHQRNRATLGIQLRDSKSHPAGTKLEQMYLDSKKKVIEYKL